MTPTSTPERHDIRAAAHTLGGYSAHADQTDLLNFIGHMRAKPREVILVHSDDSARQTLRDAGRLADAASSNGGEDWLA